MLALTFLVHVDRPAGRRGDAGPPDAGSWGAAFRNAPDLAGLLGLSLALFLLFGSVYVALPLHVAEDLGSGVSTPAAFYTAFGVGAVAGGLLSGQLRRCPHRPVILSLVVAIGLAMLPVGLAVPTPLALMSFAVAGLLWPPYASLSTTLIQRRAEPTSLPTILAAWSAVRVVSVPAGTLLGGPLVVLAGPQGSLLAAAIGIIVLGCGATAVTMPGRRRR